MNDSQRDSLVLKLFRRPALLPSDNAIRVPVPPKSYSKRVDVVRMKKKDEAVFSLVRRIGAWFALRKKPFWEEHLTTLFYGPRSQGKSLHQAKTVRDIFAYLDNLYTLYPTLPHAIVVSNQKFNSTIEKQQLGTHLFYWENIQQLKFCPRQNCWKSQEVKVINQKWVNAFKNKPGKKEGIPIPEYSNKQHRLHDCYLIIDDAATIIPADGWQDLPRWFRKVFAQAGHNGVHVVANIQDPVSCDINFRRYVDLAFKFHKICGNRRPEAGKPPINFVWGVYTSREIPAEELWKNGDLSEAEIEQKEIDRREQESIAREAGRKIAKSTRDHWKRRYHIVRRRDTEIYDTLQNVPEYMPNSYEHIEMRCTDPNCKYIHVRHRVI